MTVLDANRVAHDLVALIALIDNAEKHADSNPAEFAATIRLLGENGLMTRLEDGRASWAPFTAQHDVVQRLSWMPLIGDCRMIMNRLRSFRKQLCGVLVDLDFHGIDQRRR